MYACLGPTRSLLWIAPLAIFAGCAGGAGDPCSGISGVCLSLRVQGSATGLDQLQVTVNRPIPKSLRTPLPPRSFKLPVNLAVVLPAGTVGVVDLIVDGISAGRAVAHHEQTITLVGGRAKVTVVLTAGTVVCNPPCTGKMKCAAASKTCVDCLSDADCPTGQYCDTDTGSLSCLDGCRQASDCDGLGLAMPDCCGHRCVDLQSNATACGSCQLACTLPNALTLCNAGTCEFAGCNSGFANCDTLESNGCEFPVDADPQNCGACFRVCTGQNVTNNTCVAGACDHDACLAGFDDCDGNRENGCEEPVNTLSHCGSCAPCAPAHASGATCSSAGVCDYTTCAAGFDDCDGDAANGCESDAATSQLIDCDNLRPNGCETDKTTSPLHCGACNRPCNTTTVKNATNPTCLAGACNYTACNTNYQDCDNNRTNGCESNRLTDALHCGSCSIACPVGKPVCLNGACVPSECTSALNIDDATRSISYGTGGACDQTLTARWYRFINQTGTRIPTSSPNPSHCGTDAPGWLSGSYPTTVGSTANGVTVCYHWTSPCEWSTQINITHCGGYFVFYLTPTPFCYLRYCGAP